MPGIKCPKCAYTNPEGQPTCLQCATPLPRVKTVGDEAPAAAPRAEPAPFRPGETVAGRYTVISMVGRGGMGCIYRVRDNALKEDVALKTLLPQLLKDKMVVERFFNEARIARGLSHTNIVRVHDIGMTRATSGNVIYISMELVKGRSLRAILEALPTGQRLPVKTALRIFDELCGALEYAHRFTVHRDIKPENVMVCEEGARPGDGSAKLMDFGISKLMAVTRLTQTAVIMGTPFYMSPEQLRNSAEVDARADIYSLGVMLYEILTGQMLTGIPKPASRLTREVPPALDPIVAKCVETEPGDRYQNVTELRKDLRAIREMVDTGFVAEPTPVHAQPGAQARRATGAARKLAGTLLLVLLAGLTAGGLYALEARRAKVSPPKQSAAPVPQSGESEQFEREVQRDKKAISTIKNSPMLRHTETADRFAANADNFLARAESAGMTREGSRLARQALQSYEAALYGPPDMVFVPAGEVVMAESAPAGPGADATVFVDGFFIDPTEVTNAQFAQFCAANNWPPRSDLANAQPEAPVANVTFYDAEAYAGALKRKLPTEAQWARAAYGAPGASRKYPWGDSWQPDSANLGGNEDGFPYAAPVKSFETDKSAFGCYDMLGNVSEWTRSLFKPLPYAPRDGREDEAKVTFGAVLTVRGGNFTDAGHPMLAGRYSAPFESASPTLGFRCVYELPTLDELERQ